MISFYFFIPMSVLVPRNSQKVSLMTGSPFPSAFPFSQLLPESQTGEYFLPSADTDSRIATDKAIADT